MISSYWAQSRSSFSTAGKLDPAVGREVVGGIARGCIEADAALIGGETAEMHGLYGGGDYDFGGFAVGAVERGKLLPRADIKPGDFVLGLRSSGLHSNGFSLVRRIVEQGSLAWTDPAPFAQGRLLGEALLTPTRIYVKPTLRMLTQTNAIKALAHITGGGFGGNIPRILPEALRAEINLSAIPVPEVFKWLAATGGVAEQEMLRTFNCGIGMIVIVDSDKSAEVLQAFESVGESPVMLGRIVSTDAEARVIYSGRLDL